MTLWGLRCYHKNWKFRVAPTVKGLVSSGRFEWVTKHCSVPHGLHSYRLLADVNRLCVANFYSYFSKFPTFLKAHLSVTSCPCGSEDK